MIVVRLVQYFFLDLAHLLTEEMWMDLVDNLIKFPSAFSLPPSIIKLTQASTGSILELNWDRMWLVFVMLIRKFYVIEIFKFLVVLVQWFQYELIVFNLFSVALRFYRFSSTFSEFRFHSGSFFCYKIKFKHVAFWETQIGNLYYKFVYNNEHIWYRYINWAEKNYPYRYGTGTHFRLWSRGAQAAISCATKSVLAPPDQPYCTINLFYKM